MPSLITIAVLLIHEFVVVFMGISVHNTYSTNNTCLLVLLIGHCVNRRMVGKYGIGTVEPYLLKLKKIGAKFEFEFQMCHGFSWSRITSAPLKIHDVHVYNLSIHQKPKNAVPSFVATSLA